MTVSESPEEEFFLNTKRRDVLTSLAGFSGFLAISPSVSSAEVQPTVHNEAAADLDNISGEQVSPENSVVIDDFETGQLDSEWQKPDGAPTGRGGFTVQSNTSPQGEYALEGDRDAYNNGDSSEIQRDDFTINKTGSTLRMYAKLGPELDGAEQANRIRIIGEGETAVLLDQKDRPSNPDGIIGNDNNTPPLDSLELIELKNISFENNTIGEVVIGGDVVATDFNFGSNVSSIDSIELYQGHFRQPANIVVDTISFSENESWPEFGYNAANTSHAPYNTAPKSDIKKEWSFETNGKIWPTPTVVDGTVFVSSFDGNIYAVDEETGEQEWQFETGDRVRSTPAVSDGTVFVGGLDGNLYSLSSTSGDEKWEFETNGAIESPPTVVGGLVFVGSHDGNVYAVDEKTGEQQWQFETADAVRSAAAVADGNVYIGSNDGNIYSIDVSQGTENWRYDIGIYIIAPPAVASGKVFVGTGAPSDLDSWVVALNASTGELVWEFTETYTRVASSPAVADGTVYFGSSGDYVYAVDADSGEKQWETPMEGVESSPAVVDELVFIGSDDGNLYALDTGSGEIQWQFTTTSGHPVDSSPSVVNGNVYVGSTDNRIYRITGESLGSNPDDAGGFQQVSRLVADDGNPNDYFVSAVALSGDTALIGAVGDDDPNGKDSGSAYVFERTGGSWTQQAKLTADDGDPDDDFGESIALAGDTALIGADGDDDPNGKDSGSAYVFERTGGSWTQQAKLTADDGDPDDLFGVPIALSGDRALVGAVRDDNPNGSAAGSAYVFKESSRTTTGIMVSVTPTSETIGADGTFTYDIVAENVTNDVGSVDLSVSVTDTSVAEMTDITLADGFESSLTNTSVASDGSSVSASAAGGDTSDTGSVTVATVTLAAQATGTATIDLTVTSMGDEGGSTYTINDTNSATVEVAQNSGVVVAGTTRSKDGSGRFAGDGVHQDINGDGTTTFADVTSLFNNLNSDAVQNNPTLFDFNGDDQITFADVTALFNRLL